MRVLPKHILCATDFSDFSNHAIPYGIALAREFKAKLFLCHVIDLSSAAIYGEAVLALEEQQKRMTKHAHEEMERLMSKESIAWEPLITVGNAAHEIARLAAEKDRYHHHRQPRKSRTQTSHPGIRDRTTDEDPPLPPLGRSQPRAGIRHPGRSGDHIEKNPCGV
jgi:hypothetical protein